jgi:hypothetical protein
MSPNFFFRTSVKVSKYPEFYADFKTVKISKQNYLKKDINGKIEGNEQFLLFNSGSFSFFDKILRFFILL